MGNVNFGVIEKINDNLRVWDLKFSSFKKNFFGIFMVLVFD